MFELRLQASASAVVSIDLQQGVVSRPAMPHASADVVKRSVELANRFRAKGATIVWVRVDVGNFVRINADAPFRDPNAPPPPASASALVPELNLQPGDLVVTKRSLDAFVHTELEKQLRDRNVRTIVLGGISTNAGVESTLRTAAAMGFDVVLAEDATSSTMGEEAHRFAITQIFPRLARIRDSQQIHAE